MNNLLSLQKKIVPEMIKLLDKRYDILKNIYYNQPIGRRALAQELDMGERIVRTEVNFLKDQELIEINSIGMVITPKGEELLKGLEEMIHDVNDLSHIENKLCEVLGVAKVFVVPGDNDQDSTVLKEMGRIAAAYIKSYIAENSVIALTGGSSVARVVNNFQKITKKNVFVLPARGGMGRDVETQANTLVARLASKLNANYKLLHVPDNMSQEALGTMLNEPQIKETVEKISKADILIFGIGRAKDMAIQRGIPSQDIDMLEQKNAVSEAFGYYFDKNGKIVYKMPTIGLNFSDIGHIKHVVAVAGGATKADAIVSTRLHNPNMVLVTDEGAAKKILNLQ